MSYLELLLVAAPETIVVIAALAVLSADLLALRELDLRFRLAIGAMIACAGCIAAIAWILVLPQPVNSLQGMWAVDPLTQLVKIALLVLAVFTLALSAKADFTRNVGEYFAMILLATVGMMFLVSSTDLLMIFISLELTSLSLYVLTAFNKRDPKSAQAALKYFLFGGMAAAFTLFGLSWLYGMSGSTNLVEIARGLAEPGGYAVPGGSGAASRALDPLLIGALVMTVVGFGFKVAAVPFHLWAPDAYEGAPAPSAAFIASGSKVASFFIFAKVMMIGFAGVEGSGGWRHYAPGWVPVLAAVAAASMILGNLAAIVQSSVRRLLAYSAIAHAGYMLLGIVARGEEGMIALVYYTVTYGLTTVGAFGVVSIVQARAGGDRLSDFAGLYRRAPLAAWSMMIFMLSLAGIPPLAGFFGKFYLFAAVLGGSPRDLGLLWLVILAVAMSAVSLYYYLQVLKQVFIRDADEDAARVPISDQVIVAVLALGVLALGCAPNLLIRPLAEAVRLAGL